MRVLLPKETTNNFTHTFNTIQKELFDCLGQGNRDYESMFFGRYFIEVNLNLFDNYIVILVRDDKLLGGCYEIREVVSELQDVLDTIKIYLELIYESTNFRRD